MSRDLTITIIGAGSASFGLETLTGLFTQEKLKGAIICLVDINEESLRLITNLANRANEKWKSKMKIVSTTNRKEVLPDSDFVVLSVAVDREDTWKKDYEIAKKYNIWHYAENGGPGSFSHTARGLAFIMPILNDIHDLAPKSWLINYTNPLPRIGYAAQHAKIKTVGLCHQIWHAYGIVGRYMANELSITDSNLLNFQFKWNDKNFSHFEKLVNVAYKNFDIKAAGLNHFIWLLDIQRRDNWEDAYPIIRSNAGKINPEFEPLTQHMFDIFGLLPGPGDTHLTEYVPYSVSKDNWSKYNIQLYDFNWAIEGRKNMWKRITDICTNQRPFDLQNDPHERVDWIISEIYSNNNAYEQSVNIENNGAISNLPDDAIVEIPALISGSGVSGMKMGKLPEAIAALCNREISIAKLMTKASIEGDRNAAIQAFALDPMVNDLEKAEKMVDEYLTVHKKYLPQFFNG